MLTEQLPPAKTTPSLSFCFRNNVQGACCLTSHDTQIADAYYSFMPEMCGDMFPLFEQLACVACHHRQPYVIGRVQGDDPRLPEALPTDTTEIGSKTWAGLREEAMADDYATREFYTSLSADDQALVVQARTLQKAQNEHKDFVDQQNEELTVPVVRVCSKFAEALYGAPLTEATTIFDECGVLLTSDQRIEGNRIVGGDTEVVIPSKRWDNAKDFFNDSTFKPPFFQDHYIVFDENNGRDCFNQGM